jgi:hypothetical protein
MSAEEKNRLTVDPSCPLSRFARNSKLSMGLDNLELVEFQSGRGEAMKEREAG